MRGFDCVAPDGSHAQPMHFEGDTDKDILDQARVHAVEYHAALGLTDDQMAGMIAQGAYDIPKAAATA